ncbi:unnamed protein product [Ceutorhynchus assimilis]|uniref:cyclin-dependent kinase n=1 Tax=Ceutorhynchus assimilis TaxID=467358 RepID=A0A9N9MPG1_9CUCU|nr:unnamed protein product [Ceutorhynchus assimilis]
MEKYEQIAVVGEGSYGLVMKCRHKETDQIVAVKKFLETEEDATIRKLALREIRMLKRLKHENLVTMIEVFRFRKRFYIVFEFLAGTVLDELEKMPGGLGEERTRERIYQVCRAINYCHSNNIMHRDVKPENILVSSLGVVKLCDFGFSRLVSSNGEPCTEYVATRWYRAPELLVGEPVYGASVDIWAIGCLFAEMITGDPLFPGESDIDQLYLIVRMLGKPCIRHQHLMAKNTQLRPMIKTPSQDTLGFYKVFPTWPLIAIDFLHSCTRMDPHERLSAEELLKHAFFTHDKFPNRFLPALRDKVNIEFNTPLLRKMKGEILISTDRRDESKIRKMPQESNWRFSLTEGTMKRKYTADATEQTIVEKNLITLSKTSQRLNILNNNNSKQVLSKPSLVQTKSHSKFKLPTSEIQMLEKSLENLVKINKYDENRPISDHNTRLSAESPTYNTFHFGLGDHSSSKSPNFHSILHPSINNISFNREQPKRSPNILQTNQKSNQVPNISNSRNHYLKKLDRNVENIFAQGDHANNIGIHTPHWLNSFNNNSNMTLRKREPLNRSRNDDFSLPNLPGAAISPNKTKKKNSIPELELPDPAEVSPAYRYRKAKRKRHILDISLPMPVKEKSKFVYK